MHGTGGAEMAGYSGTPLAKKLGLKEGFRVRTRFVPEDYLELVTPRPAGVRISGNLRKDIDILHFFSKSAQQIADELPVLMRQIKQNGMIWVSWPKKASGVPTDVTEDTIRSYALPLGLVDVKVCAVDEVWSGLKLIIRKELRR